MTIDQSTLDEMCAKRAAQFDRLSERLQTAIVVGLQQSEFFQRLHAESGEKPEVARFLADRAPGALRQTHENIAALKARREEARRDLALAERFRDEALRGENIPAIIRWVQSNQTRAELHARDAEIRRLSAAIETARADAEYQRNIAAQLTLGARVAEIENVLRVKRNLEEQMRGERLSPLHVTFREIQKNPEILDRVQPISGPDVRGTTVLWEGRERTPKGPVPFGCRPDLGRLFAVWQDANGFRQFMVWNQTQNAWTGCKNNQFPRPFWPRRTDDSELGAGVGGRVELNRDGSQSYSGNEIRSTYHPPIRRRK